MKKQSLTNRHWIKKQEKQLRKQILSGKNWLKISAVRRREEYSNFGKADLNMSKFKGIKNKELVVLGSSDTVFKNSMEFHLKELVTLSKFNKKNLLKKEDFNLLFLLLNLHINEIEKDLDYKIIDIVNEFKENEKLYPTKNKLSLVHKVFSSIDFQSYEDRYTKKQKILKYYLSYLKQHTSKEFYFNIMRKLNSRPFIDMSVKIKQNLEKEELIIKEKKEKLTLLDYKLHHRIAEKFMVDNNISKKEYGLIQEEFLKLMFLKNKLSKKIKSPSIAVNLLWEAFSKDSTYKMFSKTVFKEDVTPSTAEFPEATAFIEVANDYEKEFSSYSIFYLDQKIGFKEGYSFHISRNRKNTLDITSCPLTKKFEKESSNNTYDYSSNQSSSDSSSDTLAMTTVLMSAVG